MFTVLIVLMETEILNDACSYIFKNSVFSDGSFRLISLEGIPSFLNAYFAKENMYIVMETCWTGDATRIKDKEGCFGGGSIALPRGYRV